MWLPRQPLAATLTGATKEDHTGSRTELQTRLLMLLKEHNQRDTLARFKTGLLAQVANRTAKYGRLRQADVDIAFQAFEDWQLCGCPGMPVFYLSTTHDTVVRCVIVQRLSLIHI